MKKIYSAPTIELERFDVEDIITDSGETPAAAAIIRDNGSGAYEVIIESAW